MGRHAKQGLSCSEADRKELERISRSHSEPKRRVERARIILACLLSDNQASVAEALDTRPNTGNKWRHRFARHGLGGLDDAPRSGKPKRVGKDLRTKILKRLETPPPK